MSKVKIKKIPLLLGVSVSNFLSCITPFGIGGDIFFSYFLYKNNISKEKIVSITIISSTMYHLSLSILAIISFLLTFIIFASDSYFQNQGAKSMFIISGVSLLIEILFVIFTLFLGKSKKLLSIIFYIIFKIQRVFNLFFRLSEKHFENLRDKVLTSCENSSNNFNELLKNKKIFFSCLSLSFLYMLLKSIFTYLLMISVLKRGINFIAGNSLLIMVESANVFVPIPSGIISLD